MIDVENEVFNDTAVALRAKYNPISVYGERVAEPAVFPSVSIVEKDNYNVERTRTGPTSENHVGVMYEVDVYSNKSVGKKSQSKEVLAVIDTVLSGFGFVRTYSGPIPNANDNTIYRMKARYTAMVSKEQRVYDL